MAKPSLPFTGVDYTFVKYLTKEQQARVVPLLQEMERNVKDKKGVWNVDLQNLKYAMDRKVLSSYEDRSPVHHCLREIFKKHKIKPRELGNPRARKNDEFDLPQVIDTAWGLSRYVTLAPTAYRNLKELVDGKPSLKVRKTIEKCKESPEYYSHPEPVKGWLGDFQKEFMTPMVTVAALMEAAKGMLLKGKKRDLSKPVREEYVAPPAGRKDLAQVDQLIKELLKEWYPIQVKYFTNYYVQGAEWLVKTCNTKMQEEEDFRGKKIKAKTPFENWEIGRYPLRLKDSSHTFLVNAPDNPMYSGKKARKRCELKANYKALAKAKAVKVVEEIQADFSKKQQSKLAYIVGEKQNLKNGEVLDIDPHQGQISGRMKFTFKDGDEFVVLNQCVYVTNQQGTHFCRFPTTFHDILKKKKFVKIEAEKWMKEVFIKG